jgi:RNA polymerase sigma-54 factor
MAALGVGLYQQQQMRQTMMNVPQMIQAQEMLQLPIMALEQRIQQELLDNPALEVLELEDDAEAPAAEETEPDEAEDVDAKRDQNAEETFSAVDENDYSWDEAFDEPAPRTPRYEDEDNKLDALYNSPDRPESFQEYLANQLLYLDLAPRNRALAERIIYSLEDDGYLRTPLEELVDPEEERPATLEELELALQIVQSLDPPGVAARTLKECLLLQIRVMPGYEDGYHDFEYRMIEEHLDDLGANRLPKVAKAMGCDVEDVNAVVEFLRTLNPHPGLDYGPQADLRVIPDVTILQEEGDFIIRLNNGTIPDLRVSESCREAMKAEKSQSETKKYLRERLMSAEWILYAIEQRKRTLMNVTRAIVDHQRDYFSGTTDQPGPLMMQTVADDVGIDISTVSRAVKEKYADTPRGLVCLRDLFTRQVGNPGADERSNVQIMERIRQLVENENPQKPLKDAQIVNLLKSEGINIVRRTVAKYRQNLNIPSYNQRRKYS